MRNGVVVPWRKVPPEEEALKKGMEEESPEFTEKRAEVYVNG